MKTLAQRLGLILAGGGIALAVSCGEDDGGSSTAATIGENCPGGQPLDGADCDTTVSVDDCQYASAVCECTALGWDCEAQAACPLGQPADGGDCSDTGQDCDYGDVECHCTMQGWDCEVPIPCPETQPATATDCEDPGQTCAYDQAECRCTGQDGWACEPIVEAECPEPEPSAGDACDFAMAMDPCEYGDNTCLCTGGGGGGGDNFTWICGVCPDEQPEGVCEDAGLSCDYDGTACTCMSLGGDTDPTWQCGRFPGGGGG